MSENEKQNKSEAHFALKSLRGLDVEPSPYLSHRLQANLATQNSVENSFFKKWFWQSFAAAVTLCLVISLFYFRQRSSIEKVTQYALDQSYMIRVDIRALNQPEIAYAEINLDGESIQFSSAQFAAVKDLKKLMITWEEFADKQYLPIVVKGVKAGNALVIVNFYDKTNKVIASKEMKLQFKAKSI